MGRRPGPVKTGQQVQKPIPVDTVLAVQRCRSAVDLLEGAGVLTAVKDKAR
jgi:hypothetical protein